MIAHGASSFLKERLMDMSDPYQMPVCDKCGRIISGTCVCGSKTSDVQLPYAAKLLFQELGALGLSLRIKGNDC